MPVEPHRTEVGVRRRAEVSSRPAWLPKLGLAFAAVVMTGGAVGAGVLGSAGTSSAPADLGAAVDLSAADADVPADRQAVVSRSDRREVADPAKEARLDPGRPRAETQAEQLSGSDPRTVARALMGEFGFSASQFGCLDSLWQKESGWNPAARNPSSGAHGIPQALPGSKMATVGSDWYSNPTTQIRWGLGYIQDRYGSPCAAWGHSQSHNWY